MVVLSFIDSILSPIENVIGNIIAFFYSIVPNLGFAIILVTMLLMLLLYPLTHKQQKSMLAMQELGPKMKEIKEKYKDDRQKQSEETMKLYKENGANPFGSCLPLLIQTPFFISIFRVVQKIQEFIPTESKLFKSICEPVKTAQACIGNIGDFQKLGFSPNKAEELSNALPRGKEFAGMNLSTNLNSALNTTNKDYISIFAFIALIVLIVAATYFNIARQQNRNPVQNNKMGFIKYIFPAGAGIFSIFLPGGSNLYVLTSAIWRAGQQEIIFHKVISPHREKMDLKEKQKDDSKKPQLSALDGVTSVKEIENRADETPQARAARKKRKKK
jgi:YidC/Oxa1 family membrane protein insertase